MRRRPMARDGQIKGWQTWRGRQRWERCTSLAAGHQRTSGQGSVRGCADCGSVKKHVYGGRLECWAATSSVWHGASRSNGRAGNNRHTAGRRQSLASGNDDDDNKMDITSVEAGEETDRQRSRDCLAIAVIAASKRSSDSAHRQQLGDDCLALDLDMRRIPGEQN